MYIQTQDNNKLVNVNNVAVIEIVNGEGLKDACVVAADNLVHAEQRTNIILGKYESIKRAEEIMNQIISAIADPVSFHGNLHDDGYHDDKGVYGALEFSNLYVMPNE